MSEKKVKTEKEVKAKAQELPKINAHAFSASHGLKLSTEARLFHKVALGDVKEENTVTQWEKILLNL